MNNIDFLKLLKDIVSSCNEDNKTISRENLEYALSQQGLQLEGQIVPENAQQETVTRRFEVGDWVLTTNDTSLGPLQIVEIDSSSEFPYHLRDVSGYDRFLSFKQMCNSTLQWELKYAYDGDILFNGQDVFKYKKNYDDPTSCGSYFESIGMLNGYFNPRNFDTYCTYNKVQPATKEQIEILYQNMKESGYQWDEKNKKLITTIIAFNERAKKLIDTYAEDFITNGIFDYANFFQYFKSIMDNGTLIETDNSQKKEK